MSRKETLKSALNGARVELDNLSSTIASIAANTNLSDEGKRAAIDQAKAKSEARLSQFRQQAHDVLDRASAKATHKPDTMQPVYQTALSNALQSIQLAGDKMDTQTLQDLCRPFSGDKAAEAALRVAYTQKHSPESKPWNKSQKDQTPSSNCSTASFL